MTTLKRRGGEDLARVLRWLLAAVGAMALLLPAPAHANDVDVIRTRIEAHLTAAGAPVDHPIVAETLAELQADTQTVLSGMTSTGTFVDLNYNDRPDADWDLRIHFGRILTLAQAYRTAGQAFHNDPTLPQRIHDGLAWGLQFYCVDCSDSGNWWYYEIGVPLFAIQPTLTLMGSALDGELREQLLEAVWRHIGPEPRRSAQNLVWSGLTHFHHGVLTGNAALMEVGRDALASVITTTTEDGIQPDYSFHQHGPVLYTGGYGADLGMQVARFLYLTDGTAYALPAERVEVLAHYVAEGIRWALFHNHFDASVLGRELSREGRHGKPGLLALLYLAATTSSRQVSMGEAARKMLETWNRPLPVEAAPLTSLVQQQPGVARWPQGLQVYPYSDFVVFRRPGFYASIKMLSSRTLSGEIINEEGKLGSRLSDGMMYLVRHGDEYFRDEVWPAMDWSQLPGITVERRESAANDNYGPGLRDFVGGTGDGFNGVAAMDFAAVDYPLRARKSWFFFDDAVYFLVADVADTTGYPVDTIVDQRRHSSLFAPIMVSDLPAPINVDDTVSLPGVTWLASERMGYHFPGGVTVDLDRRERLGRWSYLGADESKALYHVIFTLSIPHGVKPKRGGVAYGVVPGVTGAEMASWAASNPIHVLRNDGTGAAVRDTRSNKLGLVFWEAGELEGIRADKPCVAYVVDDGEHLAVAVADPAQGSGVVTLVLPPGLQPELLDDGVTATPQDGGTALQFPRANGLTHQARLSRGGADATHFSSEAGPNRRESFTVTEPQRWPVVLDHGDARLALDARGLTGGGAVATLKGVALERPHVVFRARSALATLDADILVTLGGADASASHVVRFAASSAGAGLFRVGHGQRTRVSSMPASVDTEYRTYEVEVDDGMLRARVDGVELLAAPVPASGPSTVGIGSDDDSIFIDDVRVRGCGDGRLDDDEPCDGTDLRGQGCLDLGLPPGVLRCSASCTLLTDACVDEGGWDAGTRPDGNEPPDRDAGAPRDAAPPDSSREDAADAGDEPDAGGTTGADAHTPDAAESSDASGTPILGRKHDDAERPQRERSDVVSGDGGETDGPPPVGKRAPVSCQDAGTLLGGAVVVGGLRRRRRDRG
ncbi:MAG: polysaccharide lyase family 8 super-sandwich domain-containing protein [Myxococcota bacterium]